MKEYICNHKKEPCTKKVPLFAALSDVEMLKIARMTNHIHYQKGQILYILACGDFFGELNLFNDDEVNNFSVFAIEDTEICQLKKADIDLILLKNPEISLKLLKAVTKRLAHTEDLAQNLATKDPEVRIAHMILEFCQKFGTKLNNGILIHLPISREEIASYVGVTRETISRKLSKFEGLGIISLTGNKQILVKNQLALKKYLQ